MSTRKTVIVIGLMAGIASLCLWYLSNDWLELQRHAVAQTYYAEPELKTKDHTYRVTIDERLNNTGSVSRWVSLESLDRLEFTEITGTDKNGDHIWDVVTISGMKAPAGSNKVRYGNNGVVRDRAGKIETRYGNWRWEPCLADKNDGRLFSESDIMYAIRTLDAALVQVLNDAHVTSKNTWDPDQHMMVMTFSKPYAD